MSILKWNLSFALHHNLKRTNYLKELQNVWKRCREGLCEWFSSIFTNLFLKMVLRLRTSPTNLIRHWTTGKRGGRGKVHGNCQSNLVPRLSNNSLVFPLFHFLPISCFCSSSPFVYSKPFCWETLKTTFLLIFNYVGFLILLREPDWFCNLTFRADVTFFRPAVHQWKIGRKMLLKESPLETLLQMFGGCWPWYSSSPQNCLLRCCILRS